MAGSDAALNLFHLTSMALGLIECQITDPMSESIDFHPAFILLNGTVATSTKAASQQNAVYVYFYRTMWQNPYQVTELT